METSFPCFEPSYHPPQTTMTNGINSLTSSFRGSQLSSIYHSIDNESGHGRSMMSGPTSEATTIQVTRTFVNYNDALSQSNNSHSFMTPNQSRKPNTLQLTDQCLNHFQSVNGKSLFGLAPLASPESLSEMSSVSSLPNGNGDFVSDFNVNEPDPSQMHTPKVLRRAPKISAPLSNIDWRTIEEYEKLGKVFYTNAKVPSEPDDDYYNTPNKLNSNILRHQFETSKSADSLDDDLKMNTNFTISDSALDRAEKIATPMSSTGTFASAVSSLSGIYQQSGSVNHSSSKLIQRLNTFEEEEYYMSRVTPEGILESHFPVFYDVNEQDHKPYNRRNNDSGGSSFTNEALPLLASLTERSTSSVSFVRRKNYVYPMQQSATPVHGSPSYRVTSSNTTTSTSSPRSSKSCHSLSRNESNV